MSATDALAATLGDALRARQWMAATAESCTGGLVAAAITAIAGSSAWFDRGFVTYSDDAKHALLGVPMPLIAEHGAVSEAVARAMAEGAIARSRAQLAVAITGIAGPGGATPTKPVGLVCFGFASRSAPTVVATRHLAGDRALVREGAVQVALEGLLRLAQAD